LAEEALERNTEKYLHLWEKYLHLWERNVPPALQGDYDYAVGFLASFVTTLLYNTTVSTSVTKISGK
jgi:hypothetical protein